MKDDRLALELTKLYINNNAQNGIKDNVIEAYNFFLKEIQEKKENKK